MIAFLSHSSEDKQYVDKVSRRLGRARAKVDNKSFSPGFDFREQIRNNLDKSTTFAFFASKNSLQSTWVKFEIAEADWKILHEQMSGAISIIIDPDIKPQDLPKWMQHCLVVTVLNPNSAAHLIQNFMVQSTSHIEPIFIGRENDLSQFTKELILDIEKDPPRILVVAGLEGIGRRTFGRHAVNNYLSMGIGQVFILEETDSIDTLYLKLVDETYEALSREKVAEEIKTFRTLSDNDKGKEIARLLTLLSNDNLIPVIVDKGSRGIFLDNDNWYIDEWRFILQGLYPHEDTYVLLIQPRLPFLRDIDLKQLKIPEFANYRLAPLDDYSVELILKESIIKMDINVSTEQIKEIVPYINGYPPAAKYVLGFIKYYGIDILLADKGMLTNFLSQRFESLIDKLGLCEEEKEILRLLEAQLSLPFAAIKSLIACTDKEAAQLLLHLIDLNLVIQIDSEYIISSPISVAVSRKLGILDRRDYGRMAKILKREFWKENEQLPTLSIIDATIHALAYCDLKELNDFRDLIIPGQIYKVAKEKYNNRRWKEAESLARRALQLDDRLHGARVILFKSLVRQKRWGEANNILEQIDVGYRREIFYLRGFLEWKRGHYNIAIQHFRHGYDAGDKSLSILRDSAYCLFVLGELEDATFFIDQALKKTRNKYVVDLAAQIAIYSDQIVDAVKYIDKLKEMDLYYYYNRRATLRYKQNKLPEALADVEEACNTDYPRLDALIQRIDIKILLNKPEVEQEILKVQSMLGENSDVLRGLWCKYHLQREQWLIADDWWKKIWQKSLPPFKDLRKSILDQKTKDIMMSPQDISKAHEELARLETPKQLPLVETDFEYLTERENQ